MASQDEDVVVRTARSLLLDTAAVRVVDHLRRAGIRAVLVKGPSIASWLYREGEGRSYLDIDLLVAPDRIDDAIAALALIDYQHHLADGSPTERGVAWQNEESLLGPHGANIDLHRRLIGVPSAEQCWTVLGQHTVMLPLAGGSVETLAPEARTLHLALHAAQNGRADTQALRDLALGIARLDARLWDEALVLATELDATPAFAAGLRLLPEGSVVADRLGLADVMDLELAVRVGGGSQDAMFFERIGATDGVRAKAAYIAREIFPTRAFLRSESALARRGAVGLAASRVVRPFRLAVRMPAATLSWSRARRRAGRPERKR